MDQQDKRKEKKKKKRGAAANQLENYYCYNDQAGLMQLLICLFHPARPTLNNIFMTFLKNIACRLHFTCSLLVRAHYMHADITES